MGPHSQILTKNPVSPHNKPIHTTHHGRILLKTHTDVQDDTASNSIKKSSGYLA